MSKFTGWIAVCLLVFLSTGAISGMYTGQEAVHSGTTTASSNLVLEMMYGSLYLILFLLLVKERERAVSLLIREKWMTVLIVLAMASSLWSVSPGETFRRSIGLLGTTLGGLYIGMYLEPKHQYRILAVCLSIAAVLSLFVGLLVPHIGISPDGWQGVFFQKNTLGRMMCLGLVCLSFIIASQRRYRLFAIAMVPLCATLLLLSGSVTAAAVTVGLVAAIPFVPVLRWPTRRLTTVGVAMTLVVIPLSLWVFQNADHVLKAMGKETHLTGRLPLWSLVRGEIATMPILGHGYAAFWSTPESDRFRVALNWDVMNAHNGFLEMMLGLGIVGLVIFVIGILRNFILAFRVARAGDDLDHAWPLFFLGFCMLWDITDSGLFAGNSVIWLLYTANAFWLVEANARSRVGAREEYEIPDEVGELVQS